MADSLHAVRDELGFGFAVRDDFVLLTPDQESADRVAADDSRLADDATYAGDREALDGDQLAVGWADLSAVQTTIASQQPPETPDGLFGAEALTGRMILGDRKSV